ncbi:uncharacterized protein LOC144106358 isoform X2 [Amblyomma americanum]
MQRFARMLSDNPKQACGLDASSVQAEKSAESLVAKNAALNNGGVHFLPELRNNRSAARSRQSRG